MYQFNVNLFGFLVIIFAPLVLVAAWWRSYRSPSIPPELELWRRRLYRLVLSALSMSCAVFLASLYWKLSTSPTPRSVQIVAAVGVVFSVAAAFSLPFAKGPFRQLLAVSAIVIAWPLVLITGKIPLYWSALILPLLLAIITWGSVLFFKGNKPGSSAALFAMLSSTLAVLLANVFLVYTRVYGPVRGQVFTLVAATSFVLALAGAFAGILASRRRRDWYSSAATFLSVWMVSIWLLVRLGM